MVLGIHRHSDPSIDYQFPNSIEAAAQELLNQGIKTSLSSVKRTLDRNGLLKKKTFITPAKGFKT
jgi:hypothetical protein